MRPSLVKAVVFSGVALALAFASGIPRGRIRGAHRHVSSPGVGLLLVIAFLLLLPEELLFRGY